MLKFLGNASSNAAPDQSAAFVYRLGDSLVRIKQELGIDELLFAIEDAKSIASQQVKDYLTKYSEAVNKAVTSADTDAQTYYKDKLSQGQPGNRSARNIERLLAMKWKANYEVAMEDLNAQMPLGQQIVSKYMNNFKK